MRPSDRYGYSRQIFGDAFEKTHLAPADENLTPHIAAEPALAFAVIGRDGQPAYVASRGRVFGDDSLGQGERWFLRQVDEAVGRLPDDWRNILRSAATPKFPVYFNGAELDKAIPLVLFGGEKGRSKRSITMGQSYVDIDDKLAFHQYFMDSHRHVNADAIQHTIVHEFGEMIQTVVAGHTSIPMAAEPRYRKMAELGTVNKPAF